MRSFVRGGMATAGVVCAVLCTSGLAQDLVGTPWQGGVGVVATTDQLMERQRREEVRASGVVRPPRIKPVLRPDRRNLSSNPDSGDAPGALALPKEGGELTGPKAQTVSTSFTGATLANTGEFPPDSMGAAGPTQFIVAVNGRIRSFDKATGVADGVLNIAPDTFFDSVMTPSVPSNFTADPRIRYDRLADRWFITIIDVPGGAAALPNRVLIAVSDSGTVTGATVWTFFFFEHDLVGMTPNSDTNAFADFPTLGIDNNALYIGVNVFSSAGVYLGTSAYVVRKSSVTGGGPIVVTAFRNLTTTPTGVGPYTPQGVDNVDPAATEGYFIGVDNQLFGRLVIRRVGTPGGTPTLSANVLLNVANTSFPRTVPHLGNTGGTNGQLDALDDRLSAAHLRNGRLWTAHNILVDTVGARTTSAAIGRNGVRWYEIQGVNGTPALVQSGTVFDSAPTASNPRWYWIPSIMVTGQGHAAVGFSVAGNADRANAGFVGRYAGDALNAMQSPTTLLTASATAYNPPGDPGGASGRRWGEYSHTSLDPSDDMTLWTIQEFNNATDSYGVRVVRLLAPPPATPASLAPAAVATGQASVVVTLTGSVVAGSGFYDPGAGFNRLAAAVSGGVAVNSATYVNPTTVTLDLDTTQASGGAKTITITNPDGQSLTGGGILTINRAPQTIIFNALSNVTFGVPPFVVSATASSGLTVTFTSTTPLVCTVSGNTVTIVAAGACTIAADQAGNGFYTAAPQVTRSFTVAQAVTTTNLGSAPNPSIFGQAVTFTATVGPSTATGIVTFMEGATTLGTGTVTSGIAVFTTGSTLATGTHAIAANYGGDGNHLPSTGLVTQAVYQGPAFTSGAGTAFRVGSPGSFAVTASGFPLPSLVLAGVLPAGVTFVDNGNGTGTLAGTPGAGTAGTYPLTLTANNGIGAPVDQIFTLTITLTTVQRTFVASTGHDAALCSIAAPCRSFAAAILRTTPGGAIIVQDSAGYGPVVVMRPVSIIAPPGVYAGVSVSSGSGIVVNPGSGRVTLRGLTIDSLGGSVGIHYQTGDALYVDRTVVTGFGNSGLHATLGSGGGIFIRDSTFRDNGVGVLVAVSSAGLQVTIERSRFERNVTGIGFAGSGTTAVILASLVSECTVGVNLHPSVTGAVSKAELRGSTIAKNTTSGIRVGAGGAGGTPTAFMSVVSSQVAENGTGLDIQAGGVMHVTDATIVRNTFGISNILGSVVSSGDNRLTSNGTDGAFTSTTSKL